MAFLVRYPGSCCVDCARTIAVGETAVMAGVKQYRCFECQRLRDTGRPARVKRAAPRSRVASGRRDLDD